MTKVSGKEQKSNEKDLEESARWYRKAEKKIKSVMIIDIDKKGTYQKTLELIRYKRDVAEGNE